MIYNTLPTNNQMSEFLEQQEEQEQKQNNNDKFRPPARASEPIIKLAIINFHNNSVAVPDCLIPDNLESSFGIVNISMRDEIPITPVIHFALNVDRSGSMSSYCADGRTKMTHIIHTIENMLRIFHKKTGSKISVRIQSFDDKIYIDVETIKDLGILTQEQLEAIITKIHRITPGGSTNIEKALIASKTHLETYMKENPLTRVAHLLLTDGEISDGSTDKTYLKTLVSNDYSNIFMGYGLDHDAPLLKSLTSSGIHNEYRFIDVLEKAGLVYGEVIHRLLYPAVEEASILTENCEIYNYATNTWTSWLEIGNLISEEKKIFHIRTTTPNQSLISIYGRTIHQTKQFEIISNKIVFQTHALPIKVDFGSKCDLTNYLFRQQTQEYLFKTNTLLEIQYELEHLPVDPYDKYNMLYQQNQEKTNEKKKLDEAFQKNKKDKDCLKKQIYDFFKTMLDHIETHDLKEDAFYKTLCDDMFIAIKSFDTQHGMMYAAARQTSQGRQQTYSSIPAEDLEPRLCDDDDDDDLFNSRQNHLTMPPRLNRGLNRMPSQRGTIIGTAIPVATVRNLDSDLNYTPSQNQMPAYSSLGVLKMMREVSYGSPDTKDTSLSTDLPGDLMDLPFP
jgi:hypothetical protein